MESGVAAKFVALLVVLIVAINLVPTVVSTVAGITTDGWTFTGHEAAATLMGLIPMLFIVGIVIYFMVKLLE